LTADEPYQIVVAQPAARTIAEELPESVAAAAVEVLTGPLRGNPGRVGVALRNELDGLWSVRRGTYRIVYRIDDAQHEVVILRVGHRRDVYRPD